MQKRVKLKDVAEMAGVAVNTASTILNQRPNSWASKETTARVFRAAKDLGYRPNKTARALQSGRYRTLGLLVQELTNPFFATMSDELESAAEQLGYDLMVENSRSSLIRETQLLADFRSLEVDGLITYLSDNEALRGTLETMVTPDLPVVALGNGVPATPLPVDHVVSDFTEGLTQAIDALLELGHKRFAFLSALAEGQAHGRRPDLFQALLRERGIPASAIEIIRCGSTLASASAASSEILKRPKKSRPTAFIAVNDLSAIAVMRAAADAGLRLPGDLSVVGVDDVPLAAYLPVSLSSIRQRFRRIAAAAVDLMISRLEHSDGEPLEVRQIVLPTHFIARESVGPAPES